MSSAPVAAPPVLADLLPGARARDAALVLSGTAVVTVAGYISIPLPFTPVPLSLATLAVLFVGATLGPLRAAMSTGIYLTLGLCGLPVYADGYSGWAFASFGYILGYVLAAGIVGTLARRRADRRVWSTLALSAIGSLTVYACGVPWLALFLGVDLMTALKLGVFPFLIGDAIKIAIVSLSLPVAWKLTATQHE